MNREACQTTVQGVTKSWTQLTSRVHDPAIPLWACIWVKLIQKETCTPKFIAALFTIAKTWMQPKCPSTDEMIKKICYTCLFCLCLCLSLSVCLCVCVCVCVCVCIKWNISQPKKEWNNAIFSMDGSRDYHTKWSKSDRKGQMYDWYCILWCFEPKKNDTNKLICKTDIGSQKANYDYQME